MVHDEMKLGIVIQMEKGYKSKDCASKRKRCTEK